MSTTKEQRFSIIITLLFLVAFTGLLLFFGFTAPFPPPVEEGILIEFGTTETGSGEIEPIIAEATKVEEVPIPPKASVTEPVKNNDKEEEVLTQDFDQTAVIEEKKRQEKKEKEALEQKKIEEEIARQQEEEIEKNKREEEEKNRKDQKLKDIKQRGKNAFAGKNPDGGTQGEGVNGGIGNQGDPNGDVNSKNRIGGNEELSGNLKRRLNKAIKLNYDIDWEGKVLIDVEVDQNGIVKKATVNEIGSTTKKPELQKKAVEEALKIKFEFDKNAKAIETGQIRFTFTKQ